MLTLNFYIPILRDETTSFSPNIKPSARFAPCLFAFATSQPIVQGRPAVWGADQKTRPSRDRSACSSIVGAKAHRRDDQGLPDAHPCTKHVVVFARRISLARFCRCIPEKTQDPFALAHRCIISSSRCPTRGCARPLLVLLWLYVLPAWESPQPTSANRDDSTSSLRPHLTRHRATPALRHP